MSVEAPPPSRHISSTPISLTSASRILETYLTNSERHPHLHPDALITPTGVTFSSHGGPVGGVVMHNLRRVAAGLRGEYLEPEKTPEPEEDDGADTESWGHGKKSGGQGGKKRKLTGDTEWQDMADYEREEGFVEIGEVGTRTTVVQDGGAEPDVEVTGQIPNIGKEARKKAKKEKNQQEKREREKKRAEKKNE
ncbi:uncharacterized protein K460DRAFT_366738 [Cucurbitaria berberidis CBS 394.84]|uniref:Uncharacterized protein n=1 Tax=Cucurbitaria berberidis CBS 394.84 TaxID=1168544 RepID=A0A9P4GIP2_9PLEO|nr:uncharacterized protein K460DRAFT_366738 [Cucurbitaria berberidis CBS 394.84]KAF1845891.1 hypothetical protein K460DRAFT_366738 [Cucurbitaria berberidis CBS 394.84]